MLIDKKRKYLLGVLTAFVIFLNFSAVNAQQKLNIMSYNIHHGRDLDNNGQLKAIAGIIVKSGVDIVGLEEVDSVCFRSGKVDQAKILAELTGMHFAYVSHFAFEGGSYGLALLSKFPIIKVTNKRLPVLTKVNGDTRALLWAKLELASGKKLLVMVAHLDYRSKISRIRQAKILMKMLKGKSGPVVLMGDLNANPDSKTVLTLENYFKDAAQPHLPTFPSNKPSEKIDYILTDRKHFQKTIRDTVYRVIYSDHCPIATQIKLSL